MEKEDDLRLGQPLYGNVTALTQFYAYVDLDNGIGRAIVHISQLSNDFDPPPISHYLSVGDRIKGLCVGRDKRTAYLEISPRRMSDRMGVRSREVVDWQVVHANEFGSILKAGSMVGKLCPTDYSWSRYRVLWDGGVLADGATIAARCSGSVDEDGRQVLEFPLHHLGATEMDSTTLSGEIILWRLDATAKKDEMLRNILYVHTERGFLFRIEFNDVLAVDEHFSIGETVKFRERSMVMNGIPLAELEPECQVQPEPAEYVLGQRIIGKITRLLPGGAMVLVGDRRAAFLPASAVLPGKGFVGSVLKVGDWVEGEISSMGDGEGRVGLLAFVRLAKESEVSLRGRDPLIDLRSERRRSVSGGFGRDASFRFAVTDKYEHVCCCCGESYRFANASAMEAAHVIPRGKRGADHISNGLCFCPIHHWAFDRGLFTISDDFTLRVAKNVRSKQTDSDWLTKLHGQVAIFPLPPEISLDALTWHRLNIFLGD